MKNLPLLAALALAVGSFVAPVAAPAAPAAARVPIAEATVAAAVPAETTQETTTAASGIPVDGGALAVTAVPDNFGVIGADDDLTITVVLTNNSGALVQAGNAAVSIDDAAATDRAAFADWLATGTSDSDDDDSNGQGSAGGTDANDSVATVPTPVVLPGQSVTLPSIVIPDADIGIDPASGFGVYPAVVQVDAPAASAQARTAVIHNPVDAEAPAATSLAVAVPLVLPADAPALPGAELIGTWTAEGGILDQQLDRLYAQPVAIGIDPRIQASILALGDTAPESALDWLRRLAVVPNTTFPLAWADSDIAATSQAGAGVLAPTRVPIDASRFAEPEDTDDVDDASGDTGGANGQGGENDDSAGDGQGTGDSASPSPSNGPDADPPAEPPLPTLDQLLDWNYTFDSIAWPAGGSVVAADLDTFAGAGLTTTIVESANLAYADPAAAPSAAGVAAGSEGTHRVLVADTEVSDLLHDAVTATDVTGWQSAVTRLSASLAVLGVEQGGVGQSGAGQDNADGAPVLLATLDRSTPTESNRLSETLAAVNSTAWVGSTGIAAATESSTPTEVSIVDTPVGADRRSGIDALLAAEAAVGPFSSVLTDPSPITGERRLALLAATSLGWTTPAAAESWPTAVQEYVDASNRITSSVSVVASSSTINQFSDNQPLPITIANELAYPVTVQVRVQPATAILDVTDSSVEVVVEADSQTRAAIPAVSVANGQVTISTTLYSPTGVQIGQPTYTTINVQAGWETAATAVLGGFLVIVFALGVVRTVRRRRRARREKVDATADQTAETHD
ncbi:DUF6049 family protein [Marisediminicola senii]|uniref:DUF6049 family protein n=1 Tax=Marisediminicola senii TaxID=2711233 RepID=UPI0013EDAF17|nr:DUF6049 family protein [Marisediminicola senii]